MRKPHYAGEAGNLAVVLPMLVAMALTGAMLWSYNNFRTTTGQASRAGLDMRRIALNILNRTKTVLTIPGGTITTTVANKCTAPSTINTDLANFRILGTTPPGNIAGSTGTYSYTYTSAAPQTLGTTCLFLDTEGYPTTEITSATLTVTYVPGSDDFINLSRQVDVSIHLVTDPSLFAASVLSHEQAQSFDLQEVVTLQASRLADYGLVVYGTAGGTAIAANGQVDFASPVYWLGPAAGLAFTKLATTAQLTNLRFQGGLDIYSPVTTNTANVNMVTMKQVFPGGVRNGVHSSDTTYFPIAGTGVPAGTDSGPTGTAWSQVIQLSSGLGLLPDLSSEPNITAALSGATIPPAITQTVTASAGTPYANLVDSCQGYYAPVVFMDTTAGSNFAITMDSTATNGIMCGFIAADSVTINLSGGAKNYFFGTVITRSLDVVSTAGETLILGTPYHNKMGQLEAFTTVSMDYLRNYFATEAQAGPARNFFVPMLRYVPSLTDTSSRFRPNGALSIYNNTTVQPIPGTVTPANTGTCNTPKSGNGVQSASCDTGSLTALYAPFVGSILPSLEYSATHPAVSTTTANDNKNDLFSGINATFDNVVFGTVDP